MHSEGILAGELKHGPLALVDKMMPVIMIVVKDPTYVKCQNALQQVVARQVRKFLPIWHLPRGACPSSGLLCLAWLMVMEFCSFVAECFLCAIIN